MPQNEFWYFLPDSDHQRRCGRTPSLHGSSRRGHLKSILNLEPIKKFIHSTSPFYKQNIFIISGLLVAKKPFTVHYSYHDAKGGQLGGSANLQDGEGTPVETSVTGHAANKKKEGYITPENAIYGYRVHVIRAAGDYTAYEDRGSFRTSSSAEQPEKLEYVEATGAKLIPNTYGEPKAKKIDLGDGFFLNQCEGGTAGH
ncbi:unnamed protein product [Clonostachys rosea]|uniref:Uncharacterized protein n=1 Tax=Bionectria ochroleuca TaxID=29856 RepID=A0ABY6U4M1_BIOOC|nr:unnamed protein product [Clonostachys rosea]